MFAVKGRDSADKGLSTLPDRLLMIGIADPISSTLASRVIIDSNSLILLMYVTSRSATAAAVVGKKRASRRDKPESCV
jgi:hypothetical protein